MAPLEPELSADRIVSIVGPTASGKSDLAMDLAVRLGGEIVSCDSVQVYRGLDIGSGKPTPADRARVPHHLLDILDLHEEMNAAVFADRAATAIADIGRRGRLHRHRGHRALSDRAPEGTLRAGDRRSFDARPARAPGRAARAGKAPSASRGQGPRLREEDGPTDRVRIVRALEVCFALGRPFSRAQEDRRPAYAGAALIVGIDPNRDELRTRVTARVRSMLGHGLLDETRRALAGLREGEPIPRPLGAIGYREAVARLKSGAADSGEDHELQRAIVTSTMQYAKRQMTYFRRQFNVEWFAESGAAVERVARWVRNEGTGK